MRSTKDINTLGLTDDLSKVRNGYSITTDKSKIQNLPRFNVPVILGHGHSVPDTLYYQANYSYIEDSSLINANSVNVTHPDLRKYYSGGSVYYPVNDWPKSETEPWKFTISDDGNTTGPLNMSYFVFYDKTVKYTHDLFAAGIKDLSKIKDQESKARYYPIQNFRHVYFDWLDDAAWDTVKANLNEVGQLVADGAYKGIIFDTEEYGNGSFGKPPGSSAFWTWKYYGNPDYAPTLYLAFPNNTYEELAAKAKQRGREFVHILNSYKKDLSVLMLYGYSHADFEHSYGMAQSPLGILMNFIDGMIESSTDETVFVDLCESNFDRESWMRLADKTLKRALKYTSADKDLYTKKMKVGYAIFRNRITASDLKKQVLTALEVSSLSNKGRPYVWIYGEHQENLKDSPGAWFINSKSGYAPYKAPVYTRKVFRHIDGAYTQALMDAVRTYSLGHNMFFDPVEKATCTSTGVKIPDLLTNIQYQIDIRDISSEDVDKIGFLVKSSDSYVPINDNYSGSLKLTVHKEAIPSGEGNGQRLTLKIESKDPVHILSIKCN